MSESMLKCNESIEVSQQITKKTLTSLLILLKAITTANIFKRSHTKSFLFHFVKNIFSTIFKSIYPDISRQNWWVCVDVMCNYYCKLRCIIILFTNEYTTASLITILRLKSTCLKSPGLIVSQISTLLSIHPCGLL